MLFTKHLSAHNSKAEPESEINKDKEERQQQLQKQRQIGISIHVVATEEMGKIKEKEIKCNVSVSPGRRKFILSNRNETKRNVT